MLILELNCQTFDIIENLLYSKSSISQEIETHCLQSILKVFEDFFRRYFINLEFLEDWRLMLKLYRVEIKFTYIS